MSSRTVAPGRRAVVVLGTVGVAVALNLAVYAVGAAAGGSYRFISAAGPAHVDAITISGFTAVPLLAGMTVAAVLSRWWRWVVPAALVVAPLLAIGSIPFMPLAVDLDAASAAALAVAHVIVGVSAVSGLVALRSAPLPRHGCACSLRRSTAARSDGSGVPAAR
jgi:hypothetical protein